MSEKPVNDWTPKAIVEEYYDEAGNWVTIYEDGSGITLSAELIEDDRNTLSEEVTKPPSESP